MSDTFEDQAFLTTDEAAEYLRVSRYTIWRWCHSGRLPAFQIDRAWRIRKEKLDELIEELEGENSAPQPGSSASAEDG